MYWLVMKQSSFYWKTYWLCDTYQPFSIHTFPDNFPIFQFLIKNFDFSTKRGSGAVSKWNGSATLPETILIKPGLGNYPYMNIFCWNMNSNNNNSNGSCYFDECGSLQVGIAQNHSIYVIFLEIWMCFFNSFFYIPDNHNMSWNLKKDMLLYVQEVVIYFVK